MNKKGRAVFAVAATLLAVAGASLVVHARFLAGAAANAPIADADSAAAGLSIGGPFRLVGADGQAVTDKTYRGKWMMVYFGYTFCPDVCPTTFGNIAQALAQLGPDASRIVPLFITVDPKRDTPKVMGEYVKSFDPRIIGLSGTPTEIAAVAKEYHVYDAAHPGDGESYLVDHSSFIYLMTPEGVFAKVMPGSMTGDAMAQTIRQLVGSTS